MEQAPILLSIFLLTIATVLAILYLFKCFLHLKFKEDAFIFMVSYICFCSGMYGKD